MSYDEIGNLLYDGYYGYTWQHGRQLVEISAGFEQAYYSYDVNGMRSSRYYLDFYEGTPHNYTYVYNGSQLTQMTKDADTLYFAYDAAGMPLSFTCGTVTYYYVTNLQGDVVAILDSTGTPVVSYTYNAWGKVLSVTGSMASTLGKLNPLTYRGYVYDWETGLYYLQSRYYNPEWGRFINADAFVSTGQGFVGNNMFAYCGNNPVNYTDPTGYLLVVDDVVILGTAALTVLVALLLVPPPVTTDVHFGSSSTLILGGDEKPADTSQAKKKSESLPKTGVPDSEQSLKNEDGTTKQTRKYDSNGNPEYDIDYNHSNGDGSHEFPHVHKWDGFNRLKTPIDYYRFFYLLQEFL